MKARLRYTFYYNYTASRREYQWLNLLLVFLKLLLCNEEKSNWYIFRRRCKRYRCLFCGTVDERTMVCSLILSLSERSSDMALKDSPQVALLQWIKQQLFYTARFLEQFVECPSCQLQHEFCFCWPFFSKIVVPCKLLLPPVFALIALEVASHPNVYSSMSRVKKSHLLRNCVGDTGQASSPGLMVL